LPDLDTLDTAMYCGAYGVSGDGSVIVGYGTVGDSESDFEAARWEDLDGDGQFEVEPLDPDWPYFTIAYDASEDGSVIVGLSRSVPFDQAFRWTRATGIEILPGLGPYACVFGVSADGRTIAGGSGVPGYQACIWVDGNVGGLGHLPGGTDDSWALGGISADGSTALGYGVTTRSTPRGEAFRWKDLNGNRLVDPDEKLNDHSDVFGLGDFPGGIVRSKALGASEDGSFVVGFSASDSGEEAFRWQDLNGNGVVDPDEKLDVRYPEFALGDLPGGVFQSTAQDVSADGSIVVGYGTSPNGQEAFLWDESRGMRRLEDVLVDEWGLGPDEFDPDWTLIDARDISYDGSVIVGLGTNPSGETQGWVVVIPEPATLTLLTLGGLAVVGRRKRGMCK